MPALLLPAGLFSNIMRELANISHNGPKWIVLDGDIDPMWIESLNTVMDDNKVRASWIYAWFYGEPKSTPGVRRISVGTWTGEVVGWLTHRWHNSRKLFALSGWERKWQSVPLILRAVERAEERRWRNPGCVQCTNIYIRCVYLLCPSLRCWLWPVMSGYLWTPPWGWCLRSAIFALLPQPLFREQVVLVLSSSSHPLNRALFTLLESVSESFSAVLLWQIHILPPAFSSVYLPRLFWCWLPGFLPYLPYNTEGYIVMTVSGNITFSYNGELAKHASIMHKSGTGASKSSHHTKMKPKYPNHLSQVMSLGARVCTIVTGLWSRGFPSQTQAWLNHEQTSAVNHEPIKTKVIRKCNKQETLAHYTV